MITTKRGATGREICSDSSTAEDEQLVRIWAQSCGNLLTHEAADVFRERLRAINEIPVRRIVAYRGRLERDGMKPSHFGPPDADKVGVGRYNENRKPVLYLASCRRGVELELRSGCKDERNLWCQRYEFSSSDLSIADFSESTLDNYFHDVFDTAETGIVAGEVNVNYDEYRFSRAIAQIVETHGFSGMIVPGVRGGAECKYKNTVIFAPGTRWENWVDGGSNPQKLDHLPCDAECLDLVAGVDS